MSSVARALELGAIPSLTAAGFVYLADVYILPKLGVTASYDTIQTGTNLLWKLLVDALAIYLGVIVGNMINNAVFRQ